MIDIVLLIAIATYILLILTILEEKYYLIFWKEEDTVSIHLDREVEADSKSVGECCQVSFGKRQYEGLIASSGNSASVILYGWFR